jgi:hypothetical protein
MSKRYTEGIAGDGAAILDNGTPITITEILNRLNDHDKLVKESDSLPCVSARTEMRKQAITVFELTKGFTGEPTDNAMKTALEMADYVMRLTNDL